MEQKQELLVEHPAYSGLQMISNAAALMLVKGMVGESIELVNSLSFIVASLFADEDGGTIMEFLGDESADTIFELGVERIIIPVPSDN